MKLIEMARKKINAINSALFEYRNYSEEDTEVNYVTEDLYLRECRRVEALERENTQLQKTISDKEATNTKNGYYTQHLKLTLEEEYREIGALKQELELAARDYSRAIKLSWGVTLFMFLYATTLSLHEAGLLPYSLGG